MSFANTGKLSQPCGVGRTMVKRLAAKNEINEMPRRLDKSCRGIFQSDMNRNITVH